MPLYRTQGMQPICWPILFCRETSPESIAWVRELVSCSGGLARYSCSRGQPYSWGSPLSSQRPWGR